MVEQNITEFHKTLGKELLAIKDRVRNLIGSRHWGEDGRYHEAVLRNVIRKFLPKNLSIGTGFVVNGDRELTKQIDIIVYDDSSPVLFMEGDFVIVLAHTVRAIIEVKASIGSAGELMNIVAVSNENSKVVHSVVTRHRKLFNGVFAYNFEGSLDSLQQIFQQGYFEFDDDLRRVNTISLGNNIFLRFWTERKEKPLSCYELMELSFAYFISNLLQSIDSNPVPYEHSGLFYPFDSKEPHLQFSITRTV